MGIDIDVHHLVNSTGELQAKQNLLNINKKVDTLFNLKTHNTEALKQNKRIDAVAKRLGLTGIAEIDEMLKLYDALDKAGLVKMKKPTD